MHYLLYILSFIVYTCQGAAETDDSGYRVCWPIEIVACKQNEYQTATRIDSIAFYSCILIGNNVPKRYVKNLVNAVTPEMPPATIFQIYREAITMPQPAEQDAEATLPKQLPTALLVTAMQKEQTTHFTICTPRSSQGFFSESNGRFRFIKKEDGTFEVQRSEIQPRQKPRSSRLLGSYSQRPASFSIFPESSITHEVYEAFDPDKDLDESAYIVIDINHKPHDKDSCFIL